MQSIKEKLKNSKWVGETLVFARKYANRAYVSGIFVLGLTAAFLAGRLITTFESRLPLNLVENAYATTRSNTLLNTASTQTDATSSQNSPINKPKAADPAVLPGAYVASKTGKSYYFPWCATAKRIKEANRVWFADKAAAEAHGYKPATSCPGLK